MSEQAREWIDAAKEQNRRREEEIDRLYPEQPNDKTHEDFRGILKGHSGYDKKEMAQALEGAARDIARWHEHGGDETGEHYKAMSDEDVDRLISLLETEIVRLRQPDWMKEITEKSRRDEKEIDRRYPKQEGDTVFEDFRGILKGHTGYSHDEMPLALSRTIDQIKRWHEHGGQNDETGEYYAVMSEEGVDRLILLLEKEIERLKAENE